MNKNDVLTGALILIAEDQAFIALDLAAAVEDAGGQVAGPVASVKAASALINEHPIKAAILDFNLVDGDAVPIMKLLSELEIPMIIQSGIGLTPEIRQQFPNVTIFNKPSLTSDLIAALGTLINKTRDQPLSG